MTSAPVSIGMKAHTESDRRKNLAGMDAATTDNLPTAFASTPAKQNIGPILLCSSGQNDKSLAITHPPG
jgi:hypothetical protein